MSVKNLPVPANNLNDYLTKIFNPDLVSPGKNRLVFASRQGRTELRDNADFNVLSAFRDTPTLLKLAAATGHLSRSKILVTHLASLPVPILMLADLQPASNKIRNAHQLADFSK